MRAVEYKSFDRINFFVSYDLEKLSWRTWKNYPGGPGNDLEFGKLISLDTLLEYSNQKHARSRGATPVGGAGGGP